MKKDEQLNQAALPYRKTRRTTKPCRGRMLLIALCAAVFVVSAYMLIDYIALSVRNQAAQQRVAEQYHADAEPSEPPDTQATKIGGLTGDNPEDAQKPAVSEQKTSVAAVTAESAAPPQSGLGRHTIGSYILPQMKTLRLTNRDIVGWLTIEDVVDQPIVYRDNVYYLNHDIDHKKNIAGMLFLDENSPLAATTQNLVVHGHNMRDGSMLGKLTRYHDIGFYRTHCLFTLDTLYERARYAVFAVIDVELDYKSPKFFNFMGYPAFQSEAAFSAFLRETDAKSNYTRQIDVNSSDVLLTLATCVNEDRLVVIARRVRPGEDENEIRLKTISSMVRK